MKKVVWLLLVVALMISLCACPAQEEIYPEAVEVNITAGKIEAGMTLKDVFAEVTINDEPTACRLKLTGFAWDGYWEMADDEPVEDHFAVRLDVFYSLPKGYDVEDVHIVVDSDGGNYDGTGTIGSDAEGNVEAWSRVFYGKEPLPLETLPVETEPQHTHTWTELPGPGILVCTLEGVKNFACDCGETKSEVIPAPGHDMKEWAVTDATCTQAGRKTSSCKRCGSGFIVEIPAKGHTWSAWVNKTGRVHSRTCSVCGAEEEANHNIPSGSVTCTDCGIDIIN